MNAALQIAVDLEQGEVRLGAEHVRLLPAAGDLFYLNEPSGPLVRALRFEERSRLLANVEGQDVAERLADAALVSAGVGSGAIRIAASLALAGGGEDAPSFPDCAQFVERQHGWDAARVGETMALVVDRLCAAVVQAESNGWKQIVFQEPDVSLETLISQMAAKLSQRAVSVPNDEETVLPTKPTSQRSSTEVSTARRSSKSVSTVLPVQRVPARVLALKTDQVREFATAAIEISETEESATQPKVRPVLMPPTTKTQKAPPQPNSTTASLPQTHPTEFSPFQIQANHTNFSLSHSAAPASVETPIVLPPAAAFPTWQPLAASSSRTQPPSEPARTSSPAFDRVNEASAPTDDWLAELAQLLEAECDLRGIDP